MNLSGTSLLSLASRHLSVPRAIDTRPIGVDFGAKGLHAILLRDEPRGRVVRFERSIDDDFSLSSEQGRLRAVRELKRLSEDSGARYARAAIPESEAYIFTTRLPKEAAKDPAAAIPFKIEENVPIDAQNAVFSYSFVSGDTNDDDIAVAVAVVPKETIERYCSVFDEAGLTLVGLLTHNQASARAVVSDTECESLLLVDAHDGITDISVIHGHAVHYSATVAADAAEVIDRVKKVLAFWRARERAHDSASLPEYVLLSGSEDDIAALKAVLSVGLELPVRLGNVWTNCASMRSYVPPIHRTRSYRYASAIGCALPSARPC